MNSTDLIIFFSTFLILLIFGIGIYSIINNRKSEKKIYDFLRQVEISRPIIFRDIKLIYKDINHLKTRESPFGKCDIYLFDNSIAVLRRQKLIFKFIHEPLFIGFDNTNSFLQSDNYKFVKPDKISFNKFRQNEIDIRLTDEKYNYCKTELTLKKLTTEQITALKIIEEWNLSKQGK